MDINEKKFCFIMCANQEHYEKESLRFIQALKIPDDYEVDTKVIHGARSMTQGYNQAMIESDAKYKIYLHQDSFITEPFFLKKLLEVFSDTSVGMLGLVGTAEMPANAVMWDGPRYGCHYECDIVFSNECHQQTADFPYTSVQAVDGFLMATQYDLPWREDLFQGWDFYDVSQGYEFQRAGYQVVVPYMEHPWCLHDCGPLNLKNYFKWRDIFLSEYRDIN